MTRLAEEPTISGSVWRPDDAALLEHLEDESLLDRLWLTHVGPRGAVRAPSPRAARMIRLARALPNGEATAARALASGDAAELSKLLAPASLAPFEAELLHHVALYEGRVADALVHAAPESASDARIRSIAAWLALAERGDYLLRLARDIAGDALSETELARRVDAAPLDEIDEVGRVALDGARNPSAATVAAWRTLARVPRAAATAGASAALTDRATRRARAARDAAIEAALVPIEEAFGEATARGDIAAKARGILERAVGIWQRAEYDENVALFVVRHVTDVAWELYGRSQWNAMRELLSPFWPMVDALEVQVLQDKAKLAYAAPVAQMFVFRSELESPLPRQIATVERALRLHPTHRNARLVLASYLCDRATRRLDQNPFYTGQADLAASEADVARAEALYPSSKKLAPARAKLDEARRRPSLPFGRSR